MKLHVLYLPSWYPADRLDVSGSFFREQAIAFKETGWRVGVIAVSVRSLRNFRNWSPRNNFIHWSNEDEIVTYRASILNLTPFAPRLTETRVVRCGFEAFDKYVAHYGRPDIVHVHSALFAGSIAYAIKQKYGVPYVLSEHSSAYSRGLLNRAALKIAQKIACNAVACFAVSSSFAKLLNQLVRLTQSDWAVMPNSVHPTFLEQTLEGNLTNEFVFIHVSLLGENKRVDLILRAFAQQFTGDLKTKLVVGGIGPELGRLKMLAFRLKIEKQVKFAGYLKRREVLFELGHASAFVLSSRSEPFGVVLIEALAMGLPLIATKSDGPIDIITPDVGMLVPPDDVEALGQAMSKIRNGEVKFNPKKLRNLCKDRYGQDSLTQRWEHVYQNAIFPEKQLL